MKLDMRILSEVLNWTISISSAQPTKKASYRDFSKYQWSNFEGGYILIGLRTSVEKVDVLMMEICYL